MSELINIINQVEQKAFTIQRIVFLTITKWFTMLKILRSPTYSSSLFFKNVFNYIMLSHFKVYPTIYIERAAYAVNL